MEKINIAELLKDCPTGMELDCTMWDNLYFDRVENDLIHCYYELDGYRNTTFFWKNGCYAAHKVSKCVIFPKGKTTWEGFQRPFKDGDVVFYSNTIAIFKEWGDETLFRTYCTFYTTVSNPIYQFEISRPLNGKGISREARFATEEEKQKLFDVIKANGYKWNTKTKTLEDLIVPKFKVGDRIKSKNIHTNNLYDNHIFTITEISSDRYWSNRLAIEYIEKQDDWELVPNKFDITTLKPFESRVLMRDDGYSLWKPGVWGLYDKESIFPYITIGGRYKKCIPYEGNEHLLGTKDDCDEYYKTWE